MSPAADITAADPAADAPAGPAELKVTTSPRPRSRLAVQVAIAGGRCQAVYDAAFQKLSRSVKLPGFRKGKVPRPVLLQQIGPLRIRATALEDLVDSVFREALRQENIPAISRPELNEAFEAVLERFSPGEELSFTLEMDVEPSPSLKATKGLSVEAESVAYEPERVDEMLEQSRRQLATLVPVEGRAAASGDVAQISFSGSFVDSGEPISGGSSDGMEVELEVDRMIPGFVEGILGMAVGETRTVPCTFPESYPQQEAAGRAASFDITLMELKSRELPPLDDALAQQASDKQTLAEWRQDLETRLRESASERHQTNRRDALLQALVEQLEVELPETLIQEEVRNLVERTAGQIAQQGMDVKSLFTPDLIRSLMDTARPEAEMQLRRRLALQALAATEGIEVDDQAIEARLVEVRGRLNDTSSIDHERLRLAVVDDLLREALLSWLEANNTVSEKPPAEDRADGEEAAATPSTPPAATSQGAPADD